MEYNIYWSFGLIIFVCKNNISFYFSPTNTIHPSKNICTQKSVKYDNLSSNKLGYLLLF